MMQTTRNRDSEMGSMEIDEVESAKKGRLVRLGKRLAYLLRYGAEKEGLEVHEGGYVEIMELLRVPMLSHDSPDEIMQEITNSMSYRGTKRFERKNLNSTIYVRAVYGRRMERNPNHEGTKVTRLLEMCMKHVCNNLDDYDLDGFPDEFILNSMIHRLKREKRLTNKALRTILVPTIEHLDLEGCYLTEGSIKLVGQKCPNLKVLSLYGCGYIMTDHFMEILLKKLKTLESLNICGCHHLTDRTLRALVRNQRKSLCYLHCTHNMDLSEAAVLHLVLSCTNLKHLDIFDNRNISESGRQTLVEIALDRKMTISLKGLNVEGVTPSDPSGGRQNWKPAAGLAI